MSASKLCLQLWHVDPLPLAALPVVGLHEGVAGGEDAEHLAPHQAGVGAVAQEALQVLARELASLQRVGQRPLQAAASLAGDGGAKALAVHGDAEGRPLPLEELHLVDVELHLVEMILVLILVLVLVLILILKRILNTNTSTKY